MKYSTVLPTECDQQQNESEGKDYHSKESPIYALNFMPPVNVMLLCKLNFSIHYFEDS